jgi:hypothetical protein
LRSQIPALFTSTRTGASRSGPAAKLNALPLDAVIFSTTPAAASESWWWWTATVRQPTSIPIGTEVGFS